MGAVLDPTFVGHLARNMTLDLPLGAQGSDSATLTQLEYALSLQVVPLTLVDVFMEDDNIRVTEYPKVLESEKT